MHTNENISGKMNLDSFLCKKVPFHESAIRLVHCSAMSADRNIQRTKAYNDHFIVNIDRLYKVCKLLNAFHVARVSQLDMKYCYKLLKYCCKLLL